MITYDEIYNKMRSEFEAQSRFDFDEKSDADIRIRVLAGEIFNAMTSIEWLKRQMFVATATGEYLDYFASQRGIERKKAQKAQGEITFFINEPAENSIFIPMGSMVATADAEPVRYVTTEDAKITAGNTLVSVSAQADVAGRKSNIPIGSAKIIVSAPAEINYAYNREPFENGCDEETDDELRERIKASFLVPSNGTNKAYYERLALSVSGITKAGVIAKQRGTGTVDVYVSNGENSPTAAAVAEAQKLIAKNRELNVDVRVAAAQAKRVNMSVVVYAKGGYIRNDIVDICTQVFKDYLNEIEIGGTMYAAEVGKRLMNSGCIRSYKFATNFIDNSATAAQVFSAGTVNIEVK